MAHARILDTQTQHDNNRRLDELRKTLLEKNQEHHNRLFTADTSG